MKKILIALVFLGIGMLKGSADESVSYKFAAGTIDAGKLKTEMEKNISALLTEINRAGNNTSELNLSGISIDDAAKESLSALWNEGIRFLCEKKSNISKCLNDFQGYQVRSIPITIIPMDTTYNHSPNRELTISLSRQGRITGVRLGWENQEDITRILSHHSTNSAEEIRMRQEMLKWMEDFGNYFKERNIKAIGQIFSDDILILDGSETIQKNVSFETNSMYGYESRDKKSFLNTLRGIFKGKKPFVLDIDGVELMKHPAKKNIYGLTLNLKLTSPPYSDEGYLFTLWDFNDEKPIIHFRSWQPEEIVNRDGVYTLDDIYIP